MSSAAKIFLEIKNIPQSTGHIQFFRKYKLFHEEGFEVCVKIENIILIWKKNVGKLKKTRGT